MWEADPNRDLFDNDVKRLASNQLTSEEFTSEMDLRPQTLDDYIGQKNIKDNLHVLIEAAKGRGEPLDHIIFLGPPGLGKTTFAGVVAHEMACHMHATSGPAIERAGDVAAILTNLEDGDILFIDEIHRLNHAVEEMLYPAMEDYFIDIVIGKGPAAKSIRLDLPRFTLIGATTKTSLMTCPLRDRFGISFRLDYYSVEDLVQIIERSAKILGVDIDSRAAYEIAIRSRGTPRLANRMLRRVRDYAQVMSSGTISYDLSCKALDFFKIDDKGLDWMDLKILEALTSLYKGRAVGIGTIASAVGEDPATIEEIHEPYLMQKGFIIRTPQGKKATPAAFEHLGKIPPSNLG